MKAPDTLRRQLTRHLALGFAAAILVLAAGIGTVLERTYVALVEENLRRQALLAARLVEAAPGGAAGARVAALAEETGARVTLIARSGVVLADSAERPEAMENHAGRPEVARALEGGTGVAYRLSRTLGREMIYVAVPVRGEAAVVRLSLPLTRVRAALLHVGAVLFGLVLAVAAGMFWLALRQTATVTRPLEAMTEAARSLAAGDLSHRVRVAGARELQVLARSINQMADALAERITEASTGRDLLDSVLTGLPSGVLVFDRGGRLMGVNPAARAYLNLAPDGEGQRHHTEVLRMSALSSAVDAALRGERATLDGLPGAGNRVLAATAAPGRGLGVGAVVVVHDVTEARRVEAMRRDLVANVSHELKTPVTAIRGFAETLLQGALDDPEDARRFVAIIDQEARRLEALIQDLLELARLQSDPAAVQPRAGDLAAVARKVAERLRPRAEAAGIALQVEAPPGLPATFDARRLDQVITNLVENSLQHTPAGGRVTVTAGAAPGAVVLAVADTGTGIPPRDLPRIFERFYRVEKGRSRRTGGTGLGLAIVKHIVEAHGGRVRAESELGRGTTVTVELPRE